MQHNSKTHDTCVASSTQRIMQPGDKAITIKLGVVSGSQNYHHRNGSEMRQSSIFIVHLYELTPPCTVRACASGASRSVPGVGVVRNRLACVRCVRPGHTSSSHSFMARFMSFDCGHDINLVLESYLVRISIGLWATLTKVSRGICPFFHEMPIKYI